MAEHLDLDENPSYQLWLASNAWSRLFRKALEPLGLTHVQYVVLGSVRRLAHEGESVSQADVCRFASIDRNMASQVVRSLEERGLLVRQPDPKDRRAFRVEATTEGARLFDQARAQVTPLIDAFFSPLGEEKRDLARMLRSVVGASGESSS